MIEWMLLRTYARGPEPPKLHARRLDQPHAALCGTGLRRAEAWQGEERVVCATCERAVEARTGVPRRVGA